MADEIKTTGNPDLEWKHERAGEIETASVIPPHGRGRLLPPLKPGQVLNPTGRPKTFSAVRKLAQNKSMDALTALIGVYTLPNGKLDRTADGRMVTVAASTVLKWAFGEPPPYDPNAEKPQLQVDPESLARMPLEDRRQLLAALSKLTTVQTSDVGDDGPEFDASRFEPEPVTIEASTVVEPSHAAASAPIPRARAKSGQKKSKRRPFNAD